MVFSPLLIAALLPIVARAANDWSQACFGDCHWDISSETGSGTLRISGPHTAVSDITDAAGWMVMDCDENGEDQEIRLVCRDSSKGCEHIYHGNGAENTLVRLPQNCGKMPFALITREWEHENQSIPAHQLAKIVRRDGSLPVVRGMALATKFDTVDPAQTGNVSLFIQGSSLKGAAGNFSVTPPSSTDLQKRGFGDWIDDTLGQIAEIHKNISDSSPIKLDKDFPAFDQKLACPQNGNVPAFDGEVKIDLDSKVDGTVNYGVAAAGSLIPPEIKEFGLFIGLDTSISGTLNLDTTLSGSLSSGKKPLTEVGLPGLDFPGIFSIGPTFSVNAEATAELDTNINLDVDLSYNVKGMQLFFPPSKDPKGEYKPGDSNVKLSVSPNITTHGQIAAHLIPSLAFGISALGGKTKATINLDLDADTAVDLSLSPLSGKSKRDDVSGCVDISSGLAVEAGANADFFNIFKKDTSISLFEKRFDLFKKCFGNSNARRAYTGRAARAALKDKRADGAICPTDIFGSIASIVEEKVLGSSLG
ncbi:hypothetical protein BD413DRAFT_69883 [Trametes elegans]|nr:hypothetical protein BD413DRAFT_69883 [Trametes elegans]